MLFYAFLLLINCFSSVTASLDIPLYIIHEVRNTPGLPFANVSGTNYGAGLAIGKAFQERISAFVAEYDGLQQVLMPYYNTSEGMRRISNVKCTLL